MFPIVPIFLQALKGPFTSGNCLVPQTEVFTVLLEGQRGGRTPPLVGGAHFWGGPLSLSLCSLLESGPPLRIVGDPMMGGRFVPHCGRSFRGGDPDIF